MAYGEEDGRIGFCEECSGWKGWRSRQRDEDVDRVLGGDRSTTSGVWRSKSDVGVQRRST